MDEQKSGKVKVLRQIVRSKWYWITLLAIPLLAAALLTAMPYGIDYAAEQWLMSQGLDVASVEDVDFNPFTGKLVFRDLRAKVADAQVLHVPEVTLRLHWRPLFSKRAHIEKLSIQDTTVIIDHDEKGRWRIGGLAMAAAEIVADKPAESAWGFSLNQLEIRNSQVEHLLGALKVKLTVKKATMSRLRSWDKKQAARMDLVGKINDGTLKVEADLFPFSAQPSVSGNVKLEALSLQDFAELAAPYLRGLQGELGINSRLAIKQEDDKGISFSQQGKISLRQVRFPIKSADLPARSHDEGLDLHVGECVWEGQLDYGKENQPTFLRATGDLGLRQVHMDDMKRKLRLVGMSELNLKNLSAQGPNQIKVPKVRVEQLNVLQRLHDNLQAGADPSLISASEVTLQDVDLAEAREISIKTVELSGISSLLRRDSQRKWQLIDGLFGPAKRSGESATGKTGPPIVLKIENARIVDLGEFRFEDGFVSPPFKTSVKITGGQLAGLDSGKPEKSARLNLAGKIDEYTEVSLGGRINPFAQPLGFDLVAKIDDLDLPSLSSYVAELIGYKVKSGHVDVDIELRSLQGELEGRGKFKIKNVEVAPADAEIMERFERQLRVPLPTALAVLKDSNNKIKLKVPITGNITDPTFNFTDAFNQALITGMTKSAASYLKYLFQPYGTMITVVELGIMAGKKVTALRLDPVFFDPGSDTLSDNAAPYLERVAELMKTRPEILIKVCGLATEADKGDEKETSGKKKPEQPTASERNPNASEVEPYPDQLQPLTVDERLGRLAKQRAAGIKEYLIKDHEIEADRLLVCLPEYDAREKATPRVELLVP